MLILIVRLTLKDPPKNNLITVVITGSVSQGTSGDESGEEYAINGRKDTDFLCSPSPLRGKCDCFRTGKPVPDAHTSGKPIVNNPFMVR